MPKKVYKYLSNHLYKIYMQENTLILNKGYDSKLSAGSLATPIFKTSTICLTLQKKEKDLLR